MPRYNKILFSTVKASFPALTFYNEIIHTVICINEHFYNLAVVIAELHIFHYITFCFETKNALDFHLTRFLVPRTRLELARANAHYPLKVACLPISPPGPLHP